MEVLPDFVYQGPTSMDETEDEIKNNILDSPLTVVQERFIPLLVKSIQEQNKIIENLTKRIEQL